MRKYTLLLPLIPLLPLILLVLAPLSLRSQTVTATVVGTITDASAAAIPGATVTAENKQTGIRRAVNAADSGDYRIPSLQPGMYRLTIESQGFKRTVIDNLELLVDQVARVDAVLQLGDVAERV